MALSEKSRSALYQALTQSIDEEVVAEMLTQFPSRDADEAVTREHLDRRFAELRGEIAGVRGELNTGLADVRTQIAATTNRTLVWTTATIMAAAGLIIAASACLSG